MRTTTAHLKNQAGALRAVSSQIKATGRAVIDRVCARNTTKAIDLFGFHLKPFGRFGVCPTEVELAQAAFAKQKSFETCGLYALLEDHRRRVMPAGVGG